MGEGAKRVTTGEVKGKQGCSRSCPSIPADHGKGRTVYAEPPCAISSADSTCIAYVTHLYYILYMKTLTVRLPEPLAAEIEAESQARRMSKSDVVRERLQRAPADETHDPLASIRDLIGSVDDDLPADLSARKKHYLRTMKFGEKRSR